MVKAGGFHGWSPTWMPEPPPVGQPRLGVIGMGRIGAGRGHASQGLRDAGALPQPQAGQPTDRRGESARPTGESLDQMLARMDFVSVNCPHTPATYHLLSARRLKLLRPQAVIVSAARGEADRRRARWPTCWPRARSPAAGLADVYEHEPAINPKLLKLPNVVLLPHMGSATIEGTHRAWARKVIVPA
ncbi:NAD(P)-dependent oxidoreductase [Caulobacter segnis]